MNKIAQYLNEHILGEASGSESVRKLFSRDGSVLNITPQIVAHPRTTNDIRKIARFTWQLAEKGHILPMTVRGEGSDQTGAAIGKGIIINTLAHLNNILFLSLKNKDQFVHVQPGVNLGYLNKVINSHGLTIPSYTYAARYNTVGGVIANNSSNPRSGKVGKISDQIERLEVVLANGDLIETSRINKHELNKKKGLQTFEGELYRKIDGIIDDNRQTIEDKVTNDNVGYSGISKVKLRDGSFDLTPLIIGSQGTLGIISEIVLRPSFYSSDESIVVATFNSIGSAHDAADSLIELQPTELTVFDGELFDKAQEQGKKYLFTDTDFNTVVYFCFNDFGERARSHKIKKALKKLSNTATNIYTNEQYSTDELQSIRDVNSVILQSAEKSEIILPIINGASVPQLRREDFISELKDLEKKHHVSLPLKIEWISGTIYTQPTFQLHQVSEKQKMFRLMNDYAELINRYEGNFCADSGEGRLKSVAAYKQLDEDVLNIYAQIRNAFDPFKTLNPDVKEKIEMKELVSALDPDYDLYDKAKYSPIS